MQCWNSLIDMTQIRTVFNSGSANSYIICNLITNQPENLVLHIFQLTSVVKKIKCNKYKRMLFVV